MMTRMRHLFALLALLVLALPAQAAITCSVSSPGFSRAYDPALAAPSTVQTSVTVSCTRASGDPTTVVYSIKAGNGLNSNGINNRAFLTTGGNTYFLKYDSFQDSSCGTQWKGNATFSGTVDFNVSPTRTHTFWGCVQAQQTGLPAGIYTDIVTMTLSYGPNPQSSASNTFPVNISTPWTCSISTVPGTVAFGTYEAFRPTDLPAAAATFGVNCTKFLPYTLSVTPAGGTIAGVNYTLQLSTSGKNGEGMEEFHQINGTMPAGQAGTCATGSCSGTNVHTLTLTY